MIGVLLQKGKGTLDLRFFLYFQTQNATHVNLILLGGCYFLSPIRNGMDLAKSSNRLIFCYRIVATTDLSSCSAGQGNLAMSVMEEAITQFGTFIKAVNVILKLNCKTFKVLFNELSELLAVTNNGTKIQRANIVEEM